MVIRAHHHRRRAALNLEMTVAISILAIAVLPLAFLFFHEGRLLRASYRDAVAMQILDGEMEVLAAGEWRRYADGEHAIAVESRAATNLPPGKLVLTRQAKTLRLEWRPEQGRAMRREVTLP